MADTKQAEKDYLRRSGSLAWEQVKPFSPPATDTLGESVRSLPRDQFPDAHHSSEDLKAKLPMANVKPRLRMTTLYFVANTLNYMVVGTGNRSELSIGYFTKYGDGGVDLLPIGAPRRNWVQTLISDGYVCVRHPDLQATMDIADAVGTDLQLYAS